MNDYDADVIYELKNEVKDNFTEIETIREDLKNDERMAAIRAYPTLKDELDFIEVKRERYLVKVSITSEFLDERRRQVESAQGSGSSPFMKCPICGRHFIQIEFCYCQGNDRLGESGYGLGGEGGGSLFKDRNAHRICHKCLRRHIIEHHLQKNSLPVRCAYAFARIPGGAGCTAGYNDNTIRAAIGSGKKYLQLEKLSLGVNLENVYHCPHCSYFVESDRPPEELHCLGCGRITCFLCHRDTSSHPRDGICPAKREQIDENNALIRRLQEEDQRVERERIRRDEEAARAFEVADQLHEQELRAEKERIRKLDEEAVRALEEADRLQEQERVRLEEQGRVAAQNLQEELEREEQRRKSEEEIQRLRDEANALMAARVFHLGPAAQEKDFRTLQLAAGRNDTNFVLPVSYNYTPAAGGAPVDVRINQGVNPFAVLGLANTAAAPEIKAKYRTLLLAAAADRAQRALLSLAYAMAKAHAKKQVPPYFRGAAGAGGAPTYLFNAASPLVWALTGDSLALLALCETRRAVRLMHTLDGDSLLYLAVHGGMSDVVELLFDLGCVVNDTHNGSSALHAAAFYHHAELVTYLVARGADTAYRSHAEHTAAEEAADAGVRTAMATVAAQPIPSFILGVLRDTESRMGELQQIRHEGRVVAYRLVKAMDEADRMDIRANWYVAWHGTRTRHIASIVKYGLRKPGDRVGSGVVALPPGHIPAGRAFAGVADWSNAIFLTKAVKYACETAYSDRLMSAVAGEGEYCVLVEAAARPGSYSEHGETTGYVHRPGDAEDRLVEMRVESHRRGEARVENAENVVVTGIVLVSWNFISTTSMTQDQLHTFLKGNT